MSAPEAILQAGIRAPDFRLHATPDQQLALSELHGRPVILAFYPGDWSPVRGDQMALYNEVLPTFSTSGEALLGISVDTVWCHQSFSQDRKLRFNLLADIEPKGGVSIFAGDDFFSMLAEHGIAFDQAVGPAQEAADAHNAEEAPLFAHDIERNAGAGRWY